MEDAHPAKIVRFSGDLVLRDAEGLHAALVAAVEEHGHVAVDCSEAEEVDLAFVQLLVAAHRSASTRGGSLTLAGPAEGALLAALTRGGLVDPSRPEYTAHELFWTTRSPSKP